MKSRILYQYLLRQLFINWAVLIVLLTVITTLTQLPTVLNRAAENEIAPRLVIKVLILMVVANAPVLILLTLLLTVVLTLGRLGSESELTAMRAVGFSPFNILATVAVFAAPIVALLAALTLQLAPRAYCSAVLARADAARNLVSTQIRAGRFLPFGGNSTLMVNSVAADGELRQVFFTTETAGKTVVVTATRGRIRAEPAANRFFLALYDGQYREGVPGDRRFRIVYFQEYTRVIPLPEGTTSCTRPETRDTPDLLATRGAREIGELNMRFGQLALALLFVLMAVPLSGTRPREGAYSRVPLALGIFAVGNFGILGIANWSVREPQLGTTVFWGILLAGLLLALRWLASLRRI